MASYTGHKHQSTYECVDQHPEYITGHHANTNGALFYFVSPDCSGTATVGHCPPYNTGKQLTIVLSVQNRHVFYTLNFIISGVAT